MWPYAPDPATNWEQYLSLSNLKNCNTIRQFVNNGGGFIGSCYGALAASSGLIRPIPITSLNYAYTPNLPRITPSISLSLCDALMSEFLIGKDTLSRSTTEITNTNHPVTYGINDTVSEFFKGPWFVWLGKNTHQLSVFIDLHDLNDNSPKHDRLQNKIVGTPNWVYSSFGDGKLVLYSSHPEFVNNVPFLFEDLDWPGDPYYGRRVVHNSLFYVTSIEINNKMINKHHPVSYIEQLGEKTINLTIEDNNGSEFDDIITKIKDTDKTISEIKNTTIQIQNKLNDIENESKLFFKKIARLSYVLLYSDIYHTYYNNSTKTLQLLEKVYPLLQLYDESITDKIELLKTNLTWRLNQTKSLLGEIKQTAENIKNILFNNQHYSAIQKILLIKEQRKLQRTFETGVKYIPQTYFEPLKLLRHTWYNYEANIALNSK